MFLVSGASYHWIWLGKGYVKLQAASGIWFASLESSAHWPWYPMDMDPDSQGCLLQPRALALENRVKPIFQVLLNWALVLSAFWFLFFPLLSYHALNFLLNFPECGIAVPIVV